MSSDEPQRQPTEAEMQAALQEELRRVRIEQMVVESALSILNIAIMRAGLMPGTEGDKDLQQVQVGIEAVRALLPQVEALAGPEQTRPIRDALSQLQLVYAQGAGGGEPAPGGDPEATPGAGAGAAPQPPREGPGPAQGSGRLWVPGQ
ncbi:hypothetical protein Q5424_18100 [Conexibacter sp. JD483]|uniref:hypothetical protein n=1 Tax=unclassified Conexibacter TaxID=2627773 RepID=UPI002725A962|nr:MULTISPECIES: hypothetical protein [unclassified Conexibacter]MDO8184855.1 hypothetical protein [Conexibacter sp. CPCC 205706]MDO8196630.1 hypothetical protein [Conexibacter sp. CPCC 205762]MDR9371015.1 hypothetical protein [Conexibacter sp. JD483]